MASRTDLRESSCHDKSKESTAHRYALRLIKTHAGQQVGGRWAGFISVASPGIFTLKSQARH